MIASISKLVLICTLETFTGMPKTVEGELMFTTKTFYAVSVEGKYDNLVISIPKKYCKRKK